MDSRPRVYKLIKCLIFFLMWVSKILLL